MRRVERARDITDINLLALHSDNDELTASLAEPDVKLERVEKFSALKWLRQRKLRVISSMPRRGSSCSFVAKEKSTLIGRTTIGRYAAASAILAAKLPIGIGNGQQSYPRVARRPGAPHFGKMVLMLPHVKAGRRRGSMGPQRQF